MGVNTRNLQYSLRQTRALLIHLGTLAAGGFIGERPLPTGVRGLLSELFFLEWLGPGCCWPAGRRHLFRLAGDIEHRWQTTPLCMTN